MKIDTLFIGGGIGGVYCNTRYKLLFPNETTLLVDKLENYGGNMISIKAPNTDTVVEYGPIRFFPSIHTRIDYLSKLYKLDLTQYLPSEEGQYYYLRDKRFTNADLFSGSESVYNINEDEKNVNPFQLLTENLLKFIDNPETLYLLERRIELFKNNFYSDSVFKSLAQQKISEENWNRINDIIGYGDLFNTKTNFLINTLESLALTDKVSIQYRFTEGYNILPKTIISKNNIKTIDFKDLSNKIIKKSKNVAMFKTYVSNIKFCSKKKIWKIKLSLVNTDSPEDTDLIKIKSRTIYVKKIFSAIPILYLEQIHKFTSNYNNIVDNNFVNFDLLRIYIKYTEDWMTKDNIGFGRTVSTVSGGQFIHYADKILMIYAIRGLSSKLYSYLPFNKQIQREMIPRNIENSLLIDECNKVIKEVYGKKTLPEVECIGYASWIHPIRAYTGRNLQTLSNTTLFDNVNNIMFPYGHNGNFYVLDNGASFNTTWAEGSIEAVDYLFNTIYNQDLFGVTYLSK